MAELYKTMKEFFLILYIFFSMGCASMSIIPTENDGCKLKGWGSGEGTIEGKCTVKKSIFTFPNIPVRVNP